MKVALLKNLTDNFAANRVIVSKAIRELYESDPDAFLEDAANVLRDLEGSPGTRFILTLLSHRHDFLHFLCDPRWFTPAQSAGLVRQLKPQDARVEWKLTSMVARLDYSSNKSAAFAVHCLEVLGLLCGDAAALPALRELLNCPSARVRSKAALLIGRISRNAQWAKLTDVNQDPRVAANAVESIWGLDTPAAREVFRDALVSGLHRSAINGAIGLYLAREPEAILWLYSYARHDDSRFRAAAAWGMGRTGDPRFLKALDTLRHDPAESVCAAADRAAEALKHRLGTLREAPELNLQMTAEFHHGEHTVLVQIAEPGKPLRLDALHFSIQNGATPIEEYTVSEEQSDEGRLYKLKFPGPRVFSRLITVEVFSENGRGEGTVLETGEKEVKPLAEILRKLH